MQEERFDKAMQEIKRKYNDIPTKTSSQEIIQAVQQEKRHGKRFSLKQFSAVAATIGVFIIGGILIGSLLSGGDETSQEPVDDRGPGGNEWNSGDPDNDETGMLNVPDDVDPEDGDGQNRDEPDPSTERPAVMTKSMVLEGMEERSYDFELYESEALGFSTYLFPGMELVVDTNGNGTQGEEGVESEEEVSDFAEEVESFAFSDFYSIRVIRLHVENEVMWEDWLYDTFSRYEAEGYERFVQDRPMFEGNMQQGLYGTSDYWRYYAVLEHDHWMYFVEVNLNIEAGDGPYPIAAQVFVEELKFQ
ncbi:hypothetical protein SAMN05421736_10734 [Evansella caseinilytica]|uniref:DUF4367 domain-containing protein n=1 Tax=Evansella caseinilytica TaxID=1503961 RepID=A0A1H3QTU3_9BACI|nr:hypothetical protein [Evansella caseinilytica]SDZ16435.1 hypothetical protein SAMN05421736_10734 [Evansella caseinilytica]